MNGGHQNKSQNEVVVEEVDEPEARRGGTEQLFIPLTSPYVSQP